MDYNKLMDMKKRGMVNECHTSYSRGYVSRKLSCEDYPVERYSGRFGKGYVVYSPSFNSSKYCYKTYFLEPENLYKEKSFNKKK